MSGKSPNTDEILETAIERLLLPHLNFARVKHDGGRFAHYTSADAALNIIKTKRLWMRNANCMVDHQEIWHGWNILREIFAKENMPNNFMKAFNTCVPGIADSGLALFNDWKDHIQYSSYIFSCCQHTAEEDHNGRLSMWRAFGNANVSRVAFILKIPSDSEISDEMGIIFSPVSYLKPELIPNLFEAISNNVLNNSDFISSLGSDVVKECIFRILLSIVTCLKHPAFNEELEWRALYNPARNPHDKMTKSVEIINGIPQVVFKIPLDESSNEISLANIIDKIIIGPTAYPRPIFDAFYNAMLESGIDPKDKISISGIPLRTQL